MDEVVMRHRALLTAGYLLIAGLAYVGPAVAARQHDEKAVATHPAEPAKHGGDHQATDDSVFGWALDLAIWTVVVFVILVVVLSKFAWKPMLEGLRKREESIRGALDEAAKTRDEAHALRMQLQ